MTLRSFGLLRKSLPILALASLFLNLLALALPFALLQVYDRIIPNASHGTLLLLVLGVATAFILESVLRVARSAITGWVGARFEHAASVAAFNHLLGTPEHVLERDGTGVHFERMSAIPAIKENVADNGVTLALDLPFVAVFLGLIWLLAGSLVLVPLALLLLFGLIVLRQATGLRKAIAEYNTVRDRRLSFNIEVLGGIHSVKSMAMEGQMLQRYVRLQEAVAKANHDIVMRNTSALAVSGLFGQLTMVAVVAYGSTFVIDNALTVGGLAACTLLAGRAMQPIQRAVSYWTRLQGVRLSRQRAEEIFALPHPARPANPHRAKVRGAIELKSVRFRWEGAEEDLFSGLDLTVAPGECIGISGANGCGKSALLGLIRGSIQPNEGQVLLDGVPIGDWDRESLAHGGIGYLASQAQLFRGTLLDNLTMFRKELRKPALEAAHRLGLDELVATMPQGFLTRIADGASDSMPRGIRQRIAIARVLALKPRVLLFDEANTAMDGQGDERLRQALEELKGEITMILVTLRPSLLKLADRRYEIVDGRLNPREDPSLRGRAPATPPLSGDKTAEVVA
ncbi:peptidase domain-containing ABC transporter [Telmatospirillum sp. J64-1]|uniref:peptidase domain-containing ABC transporter n=1 Tax=Telmatospirillum sp. J64-1 TaxID=2502183 RepID=UPI00163D7450|nr:ABC transporter transmembrane domain-containing protein [Telmatospirillum sp. J64-1]